MFTGIIEEIGTVAMIQRGQYSAVLKIQAKTVLEGTRIGDSIAVNGVCLTVTELFPDSFKADVMHETLDRAGGHGEWKPCESGAGDAGRRTLWRAYRRRAC